MGCEGATVDSIIEALVSELEMLVTDEERLANFIRCEINLVLRDIDGYLKEDE